MKKITLQGVNNNYKQMIVDGKEIGYADFDHDTIEISYTRKEFFEEYNFENEAEICEAVNLFIAEKTNDYSELNYEYNITFEEENCVIITARRDYYSNEEARRESITVSELINILQEYPEKAKVIVSNDNGYTYGYLSNYRINDNKD